MRVRERRKRACPAAVVPTRGRLKSVAAREAIAARGAIVESASLGATRRTAVLHPSLQNANPPPPKINYQNYQVLVSDIDNSDL